MGGGPKVTCIVDGCAGSHVAKGLCRFHYDASHRPHRVHQRDRPAGCVSTREAARLTGLSYRQIHYAKSIGLVVPSGSDLAHPGSGGLCWWTEQDLVRLRFLRTVRAIGFSEHLVVAVLTAVAANPGAPKLYIDLDGTRVTTEPDADTTFAVWLPTPTDTTTTETETTNDRQVRT